MGEKKSILERLKKYPRPGSEELSELIKFIDDLKNLRNEMVTTQGLLTDLEFRENYHLENEWLKMQLTLAEEIYPEQMIIIKAVYKLLYTDRERENKTNVKKQFNKRTSSNNPSLFP